MINILYTVNGLRVNGVSAVIMQYISMLDSNEYCISLFTDEIAPQFNERIEANGVNIITSKNRKKNQFAYYSELITLLKKGRYDIIHAHGNSATIAIEMLAAKRCEVPVRIAHSHNTTCVHKCFDKILRPLFYRTYTHGIGCGVEAGKWLFRNHPHVIMKNGVDLVHFAYDPEKRRNIRVSLGIDDKYVVGHIGRFTDQKNHDFIIDAFADYLKYNNETVLLLVGDGPRENIVKKMVNDRGLKEHVIFYGTIPDTASIYSVMDVFIFPSKFEGVPLTIVEAQANGLRCLISDQISTEVVQTDLVEVLSLDKDIWVNKIGEIKKNRNNDSEIAVRKLTDAGFSLVKVATDLDKIYKEALHVVE